MMKCIMVTPEYKGGLKKPKLKICPGCGLEFSTYSPVRKYCSNYCHNKIRESKEQRRIYQKKWRKKHRNNLNIARRKYRKRIKDFWSKGQKYLNHQDKIVQESELYVAEKILPNLGFNNILLARTFSNYFPCDILARKNGIICFIEVTLSFKRQINSRIFPLIQFFNAKHFVCHLKPDNFSIHFLYEMTGNTYSSCVSQIHEMIKMEIKS